MLEKQEKKERANKRKIIKYKMQLSTNQIKEKILRFMTTFDSGNNENKTESILETREVPETRMRSYSQENIIRDQSDILEARSMFSHVNALS